MPTPRTRASTREEAKAAIFSDDNDNDKRPRRRQYVRIVLMALSAIAFIGLSGRWPARREAIALKAAQRVQSQYPKVWVEYPKQQKQQTVGMSEPEPTGSFTPEGAAKGWSPAAEFSIPRVFHQSWMSRTIPKALFKYVDTWRSTQPGWAYRLHSDADNLALVQRRYPWFEETFARLTFIQQADVARLLYMHAYGGVYADLDVELLKPIQPLLSHIVNRTGARAILGQEPSAHTLLLERTGRQACNAVLASEAGHPLWLWLLRRIQRRVAMGVDDPTDPVDSTGPRMLEKALVEWEEYHVSGRSPASIYIAHPDIFYPLWDAGQAQTFKERCEPPTECEPPCEPSQAAFRYPMWANTTDIMERHLGERVIAVCKRLSLESFEPRSYRTSFTAHHWAHTWLDENQPRTESPDDETVLDRTEGKEPAPSDIKPIDDGTLRMLGRLDAQLG